MTVWRADRLQQLPPYLFVEMDRKKAEAKAAGRDVIDLGVGDPDRPTPQFIVDRMIEALRDPAHHRYPPQQGSDAFCAAVADFFAKRFGVWLDPEAEVLALLGSKEGLGHLPTAVVDPGDVVLVPEPGYPVYAGASVLAGAAVHTMPLRPENGFLPDLAEIPSDVRRAANLMVLNYPNNPTSACASLPFFEQAVEFAREHRILIAQDAAYSELYFDEPPPSILQVEGAGDVCIEFHSLSKTFNMTGWRIGFAVGNRDALAALALVKNNLDSGAFEAIQCAAVDALRGADRPDVREQIAIYRTRRDVLVAGLRAAGWSVEVPHATFFVWAHCPPGQASASVASRILDEASVVAIPGAGFGPFGEGFVRFALTVDENRTREAVERIRRLTW